MYANFGLHGIRLYRINVEEAKDQLTSALARVAELEGLPVAEGIYDLRGGTLMTVKLPSSCNANAKTLGQAMPAKESV